MVEFMGDVLVGLANYPQIILDSYLERANRVPPVRDHFS